MSLWQPPVPSKGTKVPRKTLLVSFICKAVGVLFSLLLVLAHQNEKAWRNSLFSERRWLLKAPPIWVAISIMGREGDRSSLLRRLGAWVQITITCAPVAPQSSTVACCREKTPLQSHTKKKSGIPYARDLTRLETQDAKRRL